LIGKSGWYWNNDGANPAGDLDYRFDFALVRCRFRVAELRFRWSSSLFYGRSRMAHKFDGSGAMSRRSMLGAVGAALGLSLLDSPAATASQFAGASKANRFIRKLGKPDLCCSGPGMAWADFDSGSTSVSLTTTGRPVRLTARVPLDYGGPEGTGIGISFAENGVDLLDASKPGFAYARIDVGTIISTTLEAVTVRHVSAGTHTWTLRVRHENPMRGPDAQRLYCRTRRIAPLELIVREI
jgi:hypothetical protein